MKYANNNDDNSTCVEKSTLHFQRKIIVGSTNYVRQLM